jgi:predicted peptidase
MYTLAFLFMITLVPQPSPIIKLKKLSYGEGQTLEYALSTPGKINPSVRLPLVIALHWGWDRSQPLTVEFAKNYLIQQVLPAFGEREVLIAAPACPDTEWYLPKSEKALVELTTYLKQKYPVDTSRVIITGYSAGGFGVWFMVAKHPELFSLAVPVATLPEETWLDHWPGIPVYMIQGSMDELFPVEKAENIAKRLESSGFRVHFIRLPAVSHYDTKKYIPAMRNAIDWYNSLNNK